MDFEKYFSKIEDPSDIRKTSHLLTDIIQYQKKTRAYSVDFDIEKDDLLLDLWNMKGNYSLDFANEMNEAEKEEIRRGLEDLEQGNIVPHEEVMRKFEKWTQYGLTLF